MIGYCSYSVSVIAWNWYGRSTERFYKSGGQIVHALVLSLSKVIQKIARAEVFVPSVCIKGDFEMYEECVKSLKSTWTQ